MHSLTRDELATLDLQPQDRAVLDREFNRSGWVTVLGIRNKSVQSVTRYTPEYFKYLCQEGRLPVREEQQCVIGLD